MASREKSVLYPSATWNDCLEFIRIIDSFKLKSVSYAAVAQKFGLNNPKTKSFTSKISSAKQFGLITTSNGSTISLADMATKLLYPTGNELTSLILACFSTPPLYQKLIQLYDGKALPQVGILGNILMNDHKIARAVKDSAAQCFIESANQLEIIKGGVLCFNDTLKIVNETTPISSTSEALNDDGALNNNDSLKTSEQNDHITKNGVKLKPSDPPILKDEHEILSIPLGNKRNAFMYMPLDATPEDAKYVKLMIDIMFAQLYSLTNKEN